MTGKEDRDEGKGGKEEECNIIIRGMEVSEGRRKEMAEETIKRTSPLPQGKG